MSLEMVDFSFCFPAAKIFDLFSVSKNGRLNALGSTIKPRGGCSHKTVHMFCRCQLVQITDMTNETVSI